MCAGTDTDTGADTDTDTDGHSAEAQEHGARTTTRFKCRSSLMPRTIGSGRRLQVVCGGLRSSAITVMTRRYRPSSLRRV
jgi:hypothetical protein